MQKTNLLYRRVKKELEDIRKTNPDVFGMGEPDVLLALKFPTGHVHVHYPDEETAMGLVAQMLKDKGINLKEETKHEPVNYISASARPEQIIDGSERKIVFKHGRALGDALMFTAGVRDFKLLFPHIKINVECVQKELFEHNPYIDRSIKKGDPGVEYYAVGYPLGDINRSYRHFSSMFLLDMIANADEFKPLTLPNGKRFPLWKFVAAFSNGAVGDPDMSNEKKNPRAREPFISLRKEYRDLGSRGFARQSGDIHMTEEEKQTNIIKDVYNVDNYWVVAPGGKRDCTAKIWDWKRFQEVIDYFDGLLKFVVIGRSDHLVEKLNNVIDLTDKYNGNVRGLFSLVYHASGCVTGPSFLNHLAASIPEKVYKQRKPCVVLWGGREPTSWCHYTNHQMLHTNGAFSCCSDGGCWKARTIPLQKDPKHNKNLCRQPVKFEGRTVQACMHSITPEDVIRAIERYYEGDIYSYNTERPKVQRKREKDHMGTETQLNHVSPSSSRKINLVGNLHTSGGGEQSLCKISEVLRDANWEVNLYSWKGIHENYRNKGLPLKEQQFMDGSMLEKMEPNIPLLFYGNDSVWDFPKLAEDLVAKSSALIIGINFMNGGIPKCKWLNASGKLKAVIFQSTEKKDEFIRDAWGFEDTQYIVIPGAIDLNAMLEVLPATREMDKEMVILKHGKADGRKYVTKETQGKGKKVHVWQKHFGKELDTKFYSRLLKDTKNTRFEFMEAPRELQDFFRGEPRMVFHKWNAMPVTEFLSRGHLYLDHLSNDWRHNYPRTIGEAMAVGLPVLCEPRDGQMDRIGPRFGDSGLLCVDYDQFREGIQKFQRKEKWRKEVGMFNKDWARINLDPRQWAEVIGEVL